ncbi:hypothetical protein [Duganella violaceipulchra]|uniref:Lipoprotein n=1 Tax=Duganella violaceipulchra TaxID=2849652 RepID=A0AA41H544_9BURK|nr:hypothetical protein [Duganella violaceicalia]MBV6320174.1 hypothetical protein [Duganella violaceicalia]MCP2010541.1 hypothetical protein [Duganella violaceicalia]
MNMIRNTTIALFILTLAACASDRNSEPSASSSTSSYPSDGGNPGTTSTTTQGGNANQSSTTGTMSSSGMSGSSPSAQASYGVVQAIDQMQRQDVGVGAAGAAAAGGSVGLPTDKVYRVTVRMDDGSNQMVVVDSMPSYKTGDRVRYNNGALTSY